MTFPKLATRMSALSGEGALAVFARACELERQGHSIIHLELGEPDFHPAGDVVQAAKDALDAGKDRYCPVSGVPALRQEIAAYLQRTHNVSVEPRQVVIAPGCKITLFMAMLAVVEPGDEVLYPNPGFPAYASIPRGFGGVAVPFELAERNALQPDPDEIARKITNRTKVLILNSPGNPTGTVYTDAVQRALAELAVKHDLIVLSDEIYARIIFGREYRSMLSYPGMAERTFIVDGFSKSFAMTGWRLGYLVAPAEYVPALELIIANTYTSVAEFTQHAAIYALRDQQGATLRMVREFAKRRDQFVADLNRVPGFRCIPPDGAFYAWVNVSETGLSAEEVCRILLEEAGVAGIPGAAFGNAGKQFVRFTFAASNATLKEAAERMQKVSSAWTAAAATR